MLKPIILVIPAYCPPPSFVQMVDKLCKHFEKIVIVDDGSDKEFYETFKQINQHPNVEILTHRVNSGKGVALKTAFQYILTQGKHYNVVTADADGQHLVDDIINVSRALLTTSNALILGVRDFKNAPWRNRIGNALAATVFHFLSGKSPSDTQTGLRGIPASFLHEIASLPQKGYDYESKMLLSAVKHMYEIIEVPISTVYPADGISHFSPFHDSWKIAACAIKEIFKK